MNEKYNDTLTQRVMKKVEELKQWQYKSSKSGFETVYKDVLKDVEELPESETKSHALADVLMRGWWWLPGKKNDALFARIVAAAEEGKNEEVMTFIVSREASKLWSSADKIEFIRDKQIPRLEKLGFKYALGYKWFWLGRFYYDENKPEEGEKALAEANVLEICGKRSNSGALREDTVTVRVNPLLAQFFSFKSVNADEMLYSVTSPVVLDNLLKWEKMYNKFRKLEKQYGKSEKEEEKAALDELGEILEKIELEVQRSNVLLDSKGGIAVKLPKG